MDIRRLKPSEASLAIALSDQVFRDQDHKSMGDAFPYIFSEQCIGQSYGCFVDDKLVVFMGVVPSTICIDAKRLPVYSLGSVCTHPDYRGHGYASEVLQAIISDLKKSEASLLLISGDRSLYTRIGSKHFGEAYGFNVDAASFKKDAALQRQGDLDFNLDEVVVRQAGPNDLHAIARVANNRSVKYEQSVQDIESLVNAAAYASCMKQSHQVLVAEVQGDVQAFLILGVPYMPDANKGSVIEYGGAPLLVKTLVQSAVETGVVEELHLVVPWHEQHLLELLNNLESEKQFNQGTMLLLDSNKLLKQLEIEAQDPSTDTDLISELFNPESEGKLPKIPFPYTAGLNYI